MGVFASNLGMTSWRRYWICAASPATWKLAGSSLVRYNDAHDTALVTGSGVRQKTLSGDGPAFGEEPKACNSNLTHWKSREYYLGEWHYHPREAGQPSKGDNRQMVRIAESLDYNTPEPVLIVVGGSDWEVLAHVFPLHSTAIGLSRLRRRILGGLSPTPRRLPRTQRRATMRPLSSEAAERHLEDGTVSSIHNRPTKSNSNTDLSIVKIGSPNLPKSRTFTLRLRLEVESGSNS